VGCWEGERCGDGKFKRWVFGGGRQGEGKEKAHNLNRLRKGRWRIRPGSHGSTLKKLEETGRQNGRGVNKKNKQVDKSVKKKKKNRANHALKRSPQKRKRSRCCTRGNSGKEGGVVWEALIGGGHESRGGGKCCGQRGVKTGNLVGGADDLCDAQTAGVGDDAVRGGLDCKGWGINGGFGGQ